MPACLSIRSSSSKPANKSHLIGAPSFGCSARQDIRSAIRTHPTFKSIVRLNMIPAARDVSGCTPNGDRQAGLTVAVGSGVGEGKDGPGVGDGDGDPEVGEGDGGLGLDRTTGRYRLFGAPSACTGRGD